MYRVFALIVNLIASLTIGSFFQSGVTLNIEAPAEVVAGTEFDVHININKGSLESFSRLQQSLPAGLTATSYLSSNADFSFEDKRVRMIWLRMPQQDEFTVIYRIKADKRLKGTFDIKGLFSYIDENERKSVSFDSPPITILPSPDVDSSLIVDINEFEQKVIPYIAPSAAGLQITCIRQKPFPDEKGDSYIVNILVNKASKEKFAKIEENIPAGYKAVNINPNEAIFTYKNGTVKFLWMNLPSSPYFLVAYKLIPQDPKLGAPQPEGTFSYLEDEKTISIDIKQADRDLASLSPDEIYNLIASLSSPLLAQSDQKQKTGKLIEDAGKNKIIPVSTIVKPGSKSKKVRSEKGQFKELKRNFPYMLEPESGVYYRIQVAAGHKPVEIEKYFKKYNLDKEVRKEYHDGWHKYSIGSFPVYKDARDYRVHIWNTTIITDAFVAAYNNGKRITVQEALMIAAQRWYK
jgi:hypothetical protein